MAGSVLELGCGTGRIADPLAVLASILVNTSDQRQRTAFLATAARHVADRVVVVLQRHSPSWGEMLAPCAWDAGPVRMELRDIVRHEAALVSATLGHRFGAAVAEQDVTTQVLDDLALGAALAEADLEVWEALTTDRCWVTAGPSWAGPAEL